MARPGRPSKGMTLSKHNIELAIKSTQSMGQAALYMNVAKNTFKKYAKLHGLWDRKSTRLNSSHGYISYAVFCLKKKKKDNNNNNNKKKKRKQNKTKPATPTSTITRYRILMILTKYDLHLHLDTY